MDDVTFDLNNNSSEAFVEELWRNYQPPQQDLIVLDDNRVNTVNGIFDHDPLAQFVLSMSPSTSFDDRSQSPSADSVDANYAFSICQPTVVTIAPDSNTVDSSTSILNAANDRVEEHNNNNNVNGIHRDDERIASVCAITTPHVIDVMPQSFGINEKTALRGSHNNNTSSSFSSSATSVRLVWARNHDSGIESPGNANAIKDENAFTIARVADVVDKIERSMETISKRFMNMEVAVFDILNEFRCPLRSGLKAEKCVQTDTTLPCQGLLNCSERKGDKTTDEVSSATSVFRTTNSKTLQASKKFNMDETWSDENDVDNAGNSEGGRIERNIVSFATTTAGGIKSSFLNKPPTCPS